jgi:hypothetical protein
MIAIRLLNVRFMGAFPVTVGAMLSLESRMPKVSRLQAKVLSNSIYMPSAH